MPFDPDAYLSKTEVSSKEPPKSGFDPDAYLNKTEEPKENLAVGVAKDVVHNVKSLPSMITQDLPNMVKGAGSEFLEHPLESFSSGMNEGVRQATGGLSDKINAGITAAGDYLTTDKPYGQAYEERLKQYKEAAAQNKHDYPNSTGAAGLAGNAALTGVTTAAAVPFAGPAAPLVGLSVGSMANQSANGEDISARRTLSDLATGTLLHGAGGIAEEGANAVKGAKNYVKGMDTRAFNKAATPAEAEALARMTENNPEAQAARTENFSRNTRTAEENAKGAVTEAENKAKQNNTDEKTRFKTETELNKRNKDTFESHAADLQQKIENEALQKTADLHPKLLKEREGLGQERKALFDSERDTPASGIGAETIGQLDKAVEEASKTTGQTPVRLKNITDDARTLMLDNATKSSRYQQAYEQALDNHNKAVEMGHTGAFTPPDPTDFISHGDELEALHHIKTQIGKQANWDNLSKTTEGNKFLKQNYGKIQDLFGEGGALPEEIRTKANDITDRFHKNYKLEEQLKASSLQKLPSNELNKRFDLAPSENKFSATLKNPEKIERLQEGVNKFAPDQKDLSNILETAKALKNSANPEATYDLLQKHLMDVGGLKAATDFKTLRDLAKAEVTPVRLSALERQNLVTPEVAQKYRDILTLSKGPKIDSAAGKAIDLTFNNPLSKMTGVLPAVGRGVKSMLDLEPKTGLDIVAKQAQAELPKGPSMLQKASGFASEITPEWALKVVRPVGGGASKASDFIKARLQEAKNVNIPLEDQAAMAGAVTKIPPSSDDKDKVIQSFKGNPGLVNWLKIVAHSPQMSASEDGVRSAAQQFKVPPDKLRAALISLGKEVKP